MAEEQNKNPLAVFSFPIIIAAILAGGIIHYFSPLESLRPSKSQKEVDRSAEEEKVLARMWQDPFQAVESAIKEAKDKRPQLPIFTLGSSACNGCEDELTPSFAIETSCDGYYKTKLKVAVQATSETTKSFNPTIFTFDDNIHKILVMPVMVSAGPSSDQAEERLRNRYALLSALHVAGYAPKNPTHIGVFQTQINKELRNVPYECYLADPLQVDKDRSNTTDKRFFPRYDAVVVLWLGDEYFSKNRLEEMELIRNKVVMYLRNSTVKLHNNCSSEKTSKYRPKVYCRFIGPQYSTGLVDIYKQLIENKDTVRLILYSPWANAARNLIAAQEGTTTPYNIAKANISFTSTLHDYSKLTDVLLEELVRRQIDLSSNSQDHIVIIHEWDSFYGRAIPVSFATSVKDYRDKTYPNHLKNSKIIHSVAFLGGVDGKLPNIEPDTSTEDRNGSNQKNNPPKDFDKLIAKFEQPQGRDQYDYIQRLPKKVKSMVGDSNKIRAIGVMGVDVYDKLLILHALHDEFPNAIYFTTDLDARLWHHTELPFTRNLIVASSYGLQLHHKWQRDIPPFRSTYQTSVFVAALQALGVIKKGNVALNNVKPRIFEIGRCGDYDVTPYNIHKNKASIHPERHHQWKIIGPFTKCSYLLGLFILPCLAIIGIFYGMFMSQNTFSKGYRTICGLIWIGVLVAFIVVTKHDVAWREFLTSEISNLVYLFVPPVLAISCLIWPFIPGKKDSKDSLCFCFGKHFWICFWIFWTLCFALFATLAMASSLSGDGEPITFLDSISIWPTELIRLFNGFLATYFFFLSCQQIKRNNCEITNMVSAQKAKYSNKIYRDLEEQWNRFEKNNRPLYLKRLIIIGIIALIHLYLGYKFIFCDGVPLTPSRGGLCFYLNIIILLCSLFLMYFVFWHVVFNTFKCRTFIKDVKSMMFDDRESTQYLINKKHIKHHHAIINIIAKKTDVEATMIKYPFILLLVVCVSRYNFIDNWQWTAPLVVLVSLSILIVLCTAILLFREAATFRQKVVDRLNGNLVKLMTSKQSIYGRRGKGLKRQIEFTKFLIEDINKIKMGAFAPLSYNPILLSTLMSSGGMGVIGLLQKYVS